MKTRRILSMLLALVMVLSLVPTFAFAADGNTEGKLFLDKTATLEPDGSYTINMEAFATGTTTTQTVEKGVPLDIVLVIDQSGSMGYGMNKNKYVSKEASRRQHLIDAVQIFAGNIADNAKKYQVDHRIAVVGYAGGGYTSTSEFDKYPANGEKTSSGTYLNTGLYLGNNAAFSFKNYNHLDASDYQNAFNSAVLNDTLNPHISEIVSKLASNGGTYTKYGVDMAEQIFEYNPIPEGSDRQRIVVVFTDGQTGSSTESVYTVTDRLKEYYGASVYTVGLFNGDPGTNVNNFMFNMSSGKDHHESLTVRTESRNRVIPSDQLDTDNYYYIFADGKEREIYYYQPWLGDAYWCYDVDWFRTEKINPADYEVYEKYTVLLTGSKYYMIASNADELNAIFKTISEESTSTNTSVNLTKNSILRDIMAEGFQMTENSTVTVQVVPGTATKNVQVPEDISWKNDEAKTVLTMTLTDSSKTAEGLTASMSETQVDVTGFDYQTKYIAPQNSGSKLVVKITGVKALPTVTTDQNIYTNAENSGIYNGTDSLEPAAKFPHVPETHMTSKSYVVDYAKPLDLAIADFKLNTAKNIDKDGYNPFAPANTAITHKYGDVKLENNALTYTPKTMNWDGFDTFYVFGTTADETVKAASANANGNVWGKVNVIPANNVYYEDTFISNESTGTVGITYTGEWEEIKDETAGQNPGAAEGTDDNHGWIPVLKDENGDTDGSSHHTVASKDNVAKATFTFTGTGVDVYSHTSPKTGTISVKLAGADGNTILRTAIDTLSASGDYYQIPTLSLHEDLKGEALPYGTYTVTITVSTAAEGRYEYYLDGIRVYNPIAEDETVKGAYGDEELNATFMEVRDLLLDQNDLPEGQNAIGPVFIDKDQNEAIGTESPVVGVYKDYGPKNEVYLSSGQSISFKVDTTQGNLFQIGLKSPSGAAAAAKIGNKNALQEVTVNHTADLYYTVTPDADGFITVTNTGDALLSITKLKITNPSTTVNTAAVFAEAPVPMLLTATQEFNAANASQPDVDIENPDVPEETPENPGIWDILDKIFGGIGGWFHP